MFRRKTHLSQTSTYRLEALHDYTWSTVENALDWVKCPQSNKFDELKDKTNPELEDMAHQVKDLTDEYIKAHPDRFPKEQHT